jgi:hypothetical protein
MIKTDRYLYLYEEFGQLKMSIKNCFVKDEFSKVLNIQEDWQPIGDDKIYFFPGCVVPRFKVRDKYSCTIKPANATAAFISKTEIKEGSAVDVIRNCGQLEMGELQYLMNSNFSTGEKIYDRYRNFEDQVKGVYMSDSIMKSWWDVLTNMNYSFNDSLDKSRHYYRSKEESIYCVTPSSGIHDLTCPIYFETDILKYLNEDQLVIDEVKYQELKSFGLSHDKENLILMTELMANADFEKSFVYLLFLLKEFGPAIYPTKARDHVNFKSLLTFLGIDKRKLQNIQLNDLTLALQKHGKFTRANVQRITTLCAADTINYDVGNPVFQQGPVLRADSENLLDN